MSALSSNTSSLRYRASAATNRISIPEAPCSENDDERRSFLSQQLLISRIVHNSYISRDLRAQLNKTPWGRQELELATVSHRKCRLLGGAKGEYTIEVLQVKENALDQSLTGKAEFTLAQGLGDMSVKCKKGVVRKFTFNGKDFLNREFLPALFRQSEKQDGCYVHSYREENRSSCEPYKLYLDLRYRDLPIDPQKTTINGLTYKLVRCMTVMRTADALFQLTIQWEDRTPVGAKRLKLPPHPLPLHRVDLEQIHSIHSSYLDKAMEHTGDCAKAGFTIGSIAPIIGNLIGGVVGFLIGAATADAAPDEVLNMYTGGVRILPSAPSEEKEDGDN